MRHEPCGFLSYTKIAPKFIAADSILAIDDEPRGRQPLFQANRRILENRASLQRELCVVMLAIAFPNSLFCNPDNPLRLAPWAAHNSIGPAQFHHEFAAMLNIGEVYNRVSEVGWRFHDKSMPCL